MGDALILESGKFHYVPAIQIFIGLTRGKLHPTKVLMPHDMFMNYVDMLSRGHGPFPPLTFHGADLQISDSLSANQIEFQNEVEPTLEESRILKST